MTRHFRPCMAHTYHLGARPRLERLRGVSYRDADHPAPRGTFDFKWFPGETIRVQVQTDSASEYAKSLLRECARRWCTRGHLALNLNIEILSGDFVPGSDASGLSPYDVLARCYVCGPEGEVEAVASRTHLGNYARRQAYGQPTLHLPLYGKPTANEQPFADEDLISAMHELGHVLGLPHAHQSPKLKLNDLWHGHSEVSDWLKEAFGLAPGSLKPTELEAFIENDLKSTHWGNPEHSHWWPFTENQPVDSIMTYPLITNVLEGGREIGPLKGGVVAGPQDVSAWTTPTEADWRLLAEMYGTRAG